MFFAFSSILYLQFKICIWEELELFSLPPPTGTVFLSPER